MTFNDTMTVMIRQRQLVYEYDDDDDDDDDDDKLVKLSRYTTWLRTQQTQFETSLKPRSDLLWAPFDLLSLGFRWFIPQK